MTDGGGYTRGIIGYAAFEGPQLQLCWDCSLDQVVHEPKAAEVLALADDHLWKDFCPMAGAAAAEEVTGSQTGVTARCLWEKPSTRAL
jgi:hypothetical protein